MSKEYPNSYNGNAFVKRDGVVQNYTAHELDEYIKCRDDPEYFILNYVNVISLDKGLTKFKLYDYQKKMIRHFNDNRFSIVLACRQSGKSVTSIAWLLWYICFHSDKQVGILANKSATSREMLARLTLMLENLPFFLQPGCKELNKGSIKFSNNSKIIAASTSSSSIRGLSMNCVLGETMVCVEVDGGIYYYKINDFINNDVNCQLIKKDNYLVYETTNTINGKIYVGFHSTNNINDGYLGSGKLLKRAIEKYGPDKFTRKVLFNFDNKLDAENKEREIVNESFINRDDTYNLVTGGNVTILNGEKNPFYGKTHSKETRKSIGDKRRNQPDLTKRLHIYDGDNDLGWFNNFIQKVNDNYYQKLDAPTHNEKKRNIIVECGDKSSSLHFKDARKQKSSEELYQKFSKRNLILEKKQRYKNLSTMLKGKPKPEGFGQKISKRLKGKKKSKEHIDKINKNPEKIRKTAEKHRGSKRSDASKSKMSIAAKNRPCNNKGKKYFINPDNDKMRGYFLPGEIPNGWINKMRK